MGFRFDFTYIVLRANLGMKLRDPAGDGRWAFTPRPDDSKLVKWEEFCLSIGMSYPF
jgi:hypothetical protein